MIGACTVIALQRVSSDLNSSLKAKQMTFAYRMQAQLANKDREIQELKDANDQLRQLCIRLQTALEFQNEQLSPEAQVSTLSPSKPHTQLSTLSPSKPHVVNSETRKDLQHQRDVASTQDEHHDKSLPPQPTEPAPRISESRSVCLNERAAGYLIVLIT